MKEYLVNEKTTLKKFTDNNSPQASFFFNRMLKAKDIRINGVKVSKDCQVEEGDRIAYYMTKEQESKSSHILVYEDENIIVCDKESGVNSEALYRELCEKGECYFIHRLDRNTMGLMIFAKNRDAERELLSAFKNRKLDKRYYALSFGRFPKKSDVLTAWLKKDEKKSLVSVSLKEGRGEKIMTGYNLLSSETTDLGDEVSLAEIELLTGKTHQIRAHLAFIGCPIVGDEKYGDGEKNKKYNAVRQCLLSHSLTVYAQGCLSYLSGKSFFSSRKLHVGK